jgi:hypothetical protein
MPHDEMPGLESIINNALDHAIKSRLHPRLTNKIEKHIRARNLASDALNTTMLQLRSNLTLKDLLEIRLDIEITTIELIGRVEEIIKQHAQR